MSMEGLVRYGSVACNSFFCASALCLGAEADWRTALKIGAIFAAGMTTNMALSNVHQSLSRASTPLTYCQASLTLGGSDQVAKWATVVKAFSLVAESAVDRLFDHTNSTDDQKMTGDLPKKANEGAVALINGVTFGVLARIAGCSNKVAAATAAIFFVKNLVELYVQFQINAVDKKSFKFLSNIEFQSLQHLLTVSAGATLNFGTGRALRHLIS